MSLTNTIQKPETIRIMEERSAVRAYQKGVRIPTEELEAILTAAGLAPSAWNLQPWKFLVFEDEAQRQKLLPIANNQRHIVDSSVVVAVLADLQANLNAEAVYGERVALGLMTPEQKETVTANLNRLFENRARARDEGLRNASFAAMQLMLAAKAYGYDTCPIVGFNAEAFVEAFRVPERYTPSLLITIGKKVKDAHGKTRLPLSEIVVRESF